MIVINAEDLILGRLCTFAAKQALLGEDVNVVNSEKAVLTGDPKKLVLEYKQMRERGAPLVGPYYPRTSDRIVKRTIRGMLPIKKTRGREALAKIKCYVGVPENLKDAKAVEIKGANVIKTHAKYITIKRISKELGAKVE